jgi:hypothetical protein
MEPQGDAIEPFERAAVYLRDKMGRDPATIPETLLAIVALAAKTHEFRKHPKHGDLFLRPSAVMGRRMGAPEGLGCDVKIPEWINKLAADKPKPRPVPRPGTHVSGYEGTELLTEAEKEANRVKNERIIAEGTLMLAEKSRQRAEAEAERKRLRDEAKAEQDRLEAQWDAEWKARQ